MRIKRATHKGYGTSHGDLGFGSNREAPLHDKFGLELSPDAFIRLEQGASREPSIGKKVTLPSVSIQARRP